MERLIWAPGVRDDIYTPQNYVFRAYNSYNINISPQDIGGIFLPATQSWLDQEIFCLAYLHTD